MKTLMIGYSSDPTLRHLREQTRIQGGDFEICDLLAIRDADWVRVEQLPEDLVLQIDSRSIRFSEFSSFYNRCEYADYGEPMRNAAISRVSTSILAYLEFADALVINRLSASAMNSNKFLHAAELRRCGFKTPEHMIIGSASSAKALLDPGGDWVNKGCGGTKTSAAALDSARWERLNQLQACPSLFQRRIIGPDVRIHVVGNEIFPEMIISKNIDYRYPQKGTPNVYQDCDVPTDIRRRCFAYCKMRGLMFAGFDFKVDEQSGCWYVLEANPRPGYESYDRRQDNRISKALLSLLQNGMEETKPSPLPPTNIPFITEHRRPLITPLR